MKRETIERMIAEATGRLAALHEIRDSLDDDTPEPAPTKQKKRGKPMTVCTAVDDRVKKCARHMLAEGPQTFRDLAELCGVSVPAIRGNIETHPWFSFDRSTTPGRVMLSAAGESFFRENSR